MLNYSPSSLNRVIVLVLVAIIELLILLLQMSCKKYSLRQGFILYFSALMHANYLMNLTLN